MCDQQRRLYAGPEFCHSLSTIGLLLGKLQKGLAIIPGDRLRNSRIMTIRELRSLSPESQPIE